MRTENLRKIPNAMKRRNPDDIRFAEIAFHVGGLEFLEQFFWMFARQERQLALARVRPSRHGFVQ